MSNPSASWLAFALEQGIKHGLTGAAQLLPHVSPEVIAAQLPKELTVQLVEKALSGGKLTPEVILEVAPPQVLADHIDSGTMWQCIADAARIGKLDQKGKQSTDAGRRWLGEVLRRALELGICDAHDVVRFIPPSEWVKDAPLGVLAEMIRAGLKQGAFSPELALAHLTPKVIAENLQPSLAWACLSECVGQEIDGAPVEHLLEDSQEHWTGEPIEVIDDPSAHHRS
jgi:hypothetical protein